MNRTSQEFIRFVVSGLANTGITYLIFWVLQFFLHYSVAFTVAFCSGVPLSYVFNATFVFKTPLELGTALKFPFLYVCQYIYSLSCLAFCVELLGLSRQVAILVVFATGSFLTFWLASALFNGSRRNRWFFRTQRHEGTSKR